MATDDDDSVEEERRLFYVAVTRAKDWLYVVFPLRYYYKRYPTGDAHAYAQLTRFAPAGVQSLMDSRGGTSLEVHDGPMTDEQIRVKIARYWDRRF
jgi:DNA helicase-2/ATP-dependent DNA helicase PcrA